MGTHSFPTAQATQKRPVTTLNGAKYDKNTVLPPDLDPEEAGMVLVE